MPTLEPILEKFDRAQRGFLCACGGVSADYWNTCPREGAWSAAELVAHLMTVERSVISTAARIVRKPPRRIPLFKRLHLPLAIVEKRVIRRKTPIPIEKDLLGSKEKMLAELRSVRQRTLAFIVETKDRDLKDYRWRHPFLGSLSAYAWFSFVASHQIRHENQMWEIATALPKVIGSLQK